MHDLAGPISRRRATQSSTICCGIPSIRPLSLGHRESPGELLGCAGVMYSQEHRSARSCISTSAGGSCVNAWGHGYATEAARAALHDALVRVGLQEIIAYTAPDNLRSRAVMKRLGLKRDPSRDFTADYDRVGPWHGLVWMAQPSEIPSVCWLRSDPPRTDLMTRQARGVPLMPTDKEPGFATLAIHAGRGARTPRRARASRRSIRRRRTSSTTWTTPPRCSTSRCSATSTRASAIRRRPCSSSAWPRWKAARPRSRWPRAMPRRWWCSTR